MCIVGVRLLIFIQASAHYLKRNERLSRVIVIRISVNLEA